jgi:GT2 family glycosyltransferase
MRLSVVIVNWNSRDDLRACLSSLRTQSHQDLQVIVVDNGSTDGSVEMVEGEFPEVTLLAEAENLGFAEACNRGIAASTEEWVAMLNNDAIARPDWARELAQAAAAAPPACGMLQSLLLYLDRPTIVNSTGIELTRKGQGRDRDIGKVHEPTTQLEEIFCPTAGAAAYRRTMLEAIRLPSGYFDRDHFLYYEDMDLGWRARLAGWSASYVPRSVVLHKFHGSTRRRDQKWISMLMEINDLRTLLKNASPTLIFRPRRVWQVIKVTHLGGWTGFVGLVRAVRTSVAARAQVTSMSRLDRHAVEHRWIVRTLPR